MKQLILIVFLLLSLDTFAASMGQVKIVPILDEVAVTGAGDAFAPLGINRTFQASGAVTTGNGAASISIEGSNDGGTVWSTIDTLSLTLTATQTADYYDSTAAWKNIRGNVLSISGTNATVSLDMGVQL